MTTKKLIERLRAIRSLLEDADDRTSPENFLAPSGKAALRALNRVIDALASQPQ